MSDYIKKRGEVIDQGIRSTISKRYHTVTAAINKEFWKLFQVIRKIASMLVHMDVELQLTQVI